jgi:hypothetical protein
VPEHGTGELPTANGGIEQPVITLEGQFIKITGGQLVTDVIVRRAVWSEDYRDQIVTPITDKVCPSCTVTFCEAVLKPSRDTVTI